MTGNVKETLNSISTKCELPMHKLTDVSGLEVLSLFLGYIYINVYQNNVV